MSLLASETQTKVSACRNALQAVDGHLEPLVGKNFADVSRKLDSLEEAELQVSLAYSAVSLYYGHLLTQGIDPNGHPIMQELDRIQKYFKKVKAAKEQVSADQEKKARRTVDKEAAARIVQHYTQAAEAALQRRPTSSLRRAPQASADGSADAGAPAGKRGREEVDDEAGGSPAEEAPVSPQSLLDDNDQPSPADPGEGALEATAPEATAPEAPAAAPGTDAAVGAAARPLGPGLFADDAGPPADQVAAPPESPRKRRKGGPPGEKLMLGSAGQAKRTVAAATGAVTFSAVPPGDPSLALEPLGAAGEEEHATAAALVANAERLAARKRSKKRAAAKQ